MERRLAAVLAADMVGYSRLIAADEAGTLARQKAHRSALIDPKIAQYGGRIVKTTGDGVLVVFPGVLDAVQCAVEIQRLMPEREAGEGDERRILYRVGINLGDIVLDEGDIFGNGVNIAARLEGICEPGGVCISDVVYQNIQGQLGGEFRDGGKQALKNMERKVQVWNWRGPATQEEQPRAPENRLTPPATKPSIAVLPFTNMSGDPEQEYFAEGITEDIITELSRFRSLFVIARNSSFKYKGGAVKVQEVAADLGVQYVVEGSVRKAAGRVRITAQLIEAASGNHLWAERYDRSLEDIFAVQDEVTQAVAAAVPGQIEATAVEQGRSRPATNMTAYDCILKGEWLYYHKAPPNKEALALFEKAAEIDPGSARALARIAGWHGYSVYSHETPEKQALKTKEYAEKALELDDRDAKVHAIAASAYLHLGEYALSEEHIDRAVALNPNDAEVIFRKGLIDNYHGKHDQALEWLERAMRMDPHSNLLSLEVVFDAHYMAKRYAEALESFKKWGHPPSYMYAEAAAAAALLGDEEAASSFAETFRRLCPPHMSAAEFARRHVAICRLQEDRDHWMEGYRKAGLEV